MQDTVPTTWWVLSALLYPVPTGAWVSSLSVAGVFWVALASRPPSAGVECSCCPRYTDEIYKWTFGGQGERGERNHLKSLARRFSSLLSSSAPSKSVAFIPFWSCLLSGFHHLFIVFAIHAPSFPFSDSLCIGIWASLLWLPLWVFFVYPGHFLCSFSLFASFLLDSRIMIYSSLISLL